MNDRNISTTFAKGLAVLACFEDGVRGLTMAAVARRTGLDRATTRRLCLTLVALGYLKHNEGELSLAPKVLALSGGYLRAMI